MRALELQWLAKRHISGRSNIEQWRNQAHSLSGYRAMLVWRRQSDSQSLIWQISWWNFLARNPKPYWSIWYSYSISGLGILFLLFLSCVATFHGLLRRRVLGKVIYSLYYVVWFLSQIDSWNWRRWVRISDPAFCSLNSHTGIFKVFYTSHAKLCKLQAFLCIIEMLNLHVN